MYEPKPLPFTPDVKALAQYIADETQSIAQAQSDKRDSVMFNSLAVTPDRPREGMVSFLNGTNVGNNGAGLYEYEDSAWRKLRPETGTAVLVGGTVTVSLASITANSRIFLTSQVDGGTPGWLRVSARTAGVSFTVTSSSGTDTSTVAYLVIEP